MKKIIFAPAVFIVTVLIIILISQKYFANIILSNQKVDFSKIENYNQTSIKAWIYSFKKGEKMKLPPDFDGVSITNRLFYDFLCVRIRQKLDIKPLSYDLSVIKEFNKSSEEYEKNK